MKKIHLISTIFIGLFIMACSETSLSKKEGNIHITGSLENVAGKNLILEKFVGNQPEAIDTSIIAEDGTFELATTAESVDFYRLRISPQNAAIVILDANESIRLNGDGNDLKNGLVIEGSENTSLLWSYYDEASAYGVNSQALRAKAQELGQDQSAEKQAIIDQFNALGAEFVSFTQNFIKENSSSPAILAALGNLNIETDLEYFIIARDGLKQGFGNSNYYSSLEKQIKQYEETALKQKMFEPGNEVPNITQNDPSGNPRSLYDLRGKVVLVDFWASWCRPCRAENPNVVRLYNQYKDDGFDVFSVSLDKTQDKWVKAIEADGLVWENHVSDLQYWQSEAAQLYNVKSIPFTVLLDQQGKVIGTKLRGAALEAKLTELFGH